MTSSRQTPQAQITQNLASFAANLQIGDIPAEVIEDAGLHSLDTLGVCLASTPLPYAKAVASIVTAERQEGRSTALSLGCGFSARDAGFYNGCLGHGMDYDDSHLAAILHPTATILPGLLALAEQNGARGEEVMTALVVGIEIMCRIGVAAGPALLGRGIHPTSSCGSFGTAAAITRLMGGEERQIASAISFASSMAGGLHQSTIDGSWNKCIHSGLAVQAGFTAAALAMAGVEAPNATLEGERGFFSAFAGIEDKAARATCDDLGQSWEAANLAYKLYPACQGIHPYADCALELHDQGEFSVDEIERIDVPIGALVGMALCEPREQKYRPPTPYAAKFSIPYIVATALVRGHIGVRSFEADALADPEVLALIDRVHYEVDPVYDQGAALRGRVTVRLADGRTFDKATVAARGTPRNPWTREAVVRKFLDNAAPIVGADQANQLAAELPGIANADEVSSLLALCAGDKQ